MTFVFYPFQRIILYLPASSIEQIALSHSSYILLRSYYFYTLFLLHFLGNYYFYTLFLLHLLGNYYFCTLFLLHLLGNCISDNKITSPKKLSFYELSI